MNFFLPFPLFEKVVSLLRKMLKVMRQIFLDDRSPVHGREEGEPILKKDLQDGLYKYSCVGFLLHLLHFF